MSARPLTRTRRDALLWLALLLLPLLAIAAALQVQRMVDGGRPADLGSAPGAAQVWRNRPAPPLALPRLDGGELRLETLRGRPVLVNFWASWCAPCRRELPALEAFARQHSGPGAAQVLAVNVGEDEALVRDFLAEAGVRELVVLLDGDARVNDVWGVNGLPTSFFIDPGGEITAMQAGEVTTAMLEGRFAQAAQGGKRGDGK